MVKETYNFQLTEGQDELVIRQGEALPEVKLKSLHLSGDIFSPSEFVQKRKEVINPLITHVVINKNEGRITLTTAEDTELATTVTGKLSLSKEVGNFEIISGNDWELEKLGRFLKKNRRFFPDREENISLVNQLQNFKANVSTEIEKYKDDRGNHRSMIERKVINNIPDSFTLEMPIFEGFEKEKFTVKIGLESKDSRVVAWLESIELEEKIEDRKDDILKTEVSNFTDYVVIHQ